MSKATWIMFVDTKWPLDEFFSDVHIPFDCEFVVVRPAGDEEAILTEVYRVSPSFPLQKYRFGTWSAGGGLICTDKSFYHRRGNLQGLALKTAFLKVSVLAYLWPACETHFIFSGLLWFQYLEEQKILPDPKLQAIQIPII